MIFLAAVPWAHPHSLPEGVASGHAQHGIYFSGKNNAAFISKGVCLIKNDPDSKLLVSAAGLQSPIIGVEPHSSAVRVGESASFRCQVYSGAQPVRLEWKLANNQPLPGNNRAHAAGKEQSRSMKVRSLSIQGFTCQVIIKKDLVCSRF